MRNWIANAFDLNDLSYFVEQCPEDPIGEMIHAQINNIAHKHIVLH